MAFADEVDFDGRLLWWGLEVCTAGDDFVTVQYRWATMAGDVGGNHYDERLVSVGTIQRGLGVDHLPVASTVDVVIDNTDFVADFLANRATVETSVFKARFRLLVGVADSSANVYQATILTQQIGVFACLDFPVRNASSIHLSLSDDSLGKLNDVLVPPTMADWMIDTGNTADNALFTHPDPADIAKEIRPLVDFEMPIPIQFGAAPYIGAPAYYWDKKPTPANFDVGDWIAGERHRIFPIIVLATRSTASLVSTDVEALQGVFRKGTGELLGNNADGEWGAGPTGGAGNFDGKTITIPATFTNAVYPTSGRIWKAYKTQTITKNGYAWKLLWIAFNAQNYESWFRQTFRNGTTIHSPPVRYNNFGVDPNGNMFAAFDHFRINGYPGSGVHGTSQDTHRHPAHIMADLVEHYSAMGAAGLDSTRYARALASLTMDVKGEISSGDGAYAGTIGQQLSTDSGPYGIGALRRAVADLAKSADLDVYVTMEGKVGMSVMAANFETQTTTYPIVDEARTNNVTDRTPSAGERWSPYNRVFLKCPDGRMRGPFDDSTAITAWGRIISKALDAKWWWHQIVRKPPDWNTDMDADAIRVRQIRFTESKVRPVVNFTTDVGVLVVELGDYFTMSWTRGGQNSVYTSTLWKLEAVTINPEKGSVDVTAVWMNDLTTTQPFLLDNEALFLRVAGAGARTCTVTDASAAVTFASGSLITDGVADGDILRLRDTSEAATGFTRNRDVRIFRVTSATTLDLLASSDLDFGTAGAHVIAAADWKIVRGFRTYPNLADAPASYPSGSAMYGKISNSVGQFSDASAANQLLDG